MRISSILSFDHRCRPRPLAAVTLAAAAGFFLLPLAGGAAPPRAAAASPVAEPAADPAIVLANPVPDGRVSWSWGPGRDPFNGSVTFHRGIDVAAAPGNPVLAPAAGTISVASVRYQPSPESGTVITIDHGNGLSTFFAHLGTLEVREGEVVAQGRVIATVGSSGRSTGPHVHVEVHRDGQPVDPATFVREWQGGRR